jgi:endoglycosylceramidase
MTQSDRQITPQSRPSKISPKDGIQSGSGSGSSSNNSKKVVASIDECLAPTLVQRSICIQQKELFCDFVDVTFPGLYYSWSNRMEVNFMDFMRQQSDTPTNALVWAASTLCTVNRGQRDKDSQQMDLGRAMYIRGIQALIQLIQNPRTVKSDQTLGTAVLLGICEMIDGSFEQSWLAHSSGIAALFQHRGPDAHRDGVGRTLLISFRAFLVADALLRGEPCFLAEPAWRSVIIQSMKQENERGKGSELGDLVEYAFHEIILCPGLVARVRDMLAGSTIDIIQMRLLVGVLSTVISNLCKLQNELCILLSQGIALGNRPDLVGPIPGPVVHLLANFSLQGIDMAIDLLNRLLSSLGAYQKGIIMEGDYPQQKFNQTCIASDRIIGEKLVEGPDRLALSMGMLVLQE